MSGQWALGTTYDDVWIAGGKRTPFADYNGVLGLISPIDLGIKVARAAFESTGISAADAQTVIAGNMAQASFDAYMLPRHIGLYSGVPTAVPAMLVQRVCGTGIECLAQAADALQLKKAEVALCVGTESMSRNPVAAYTTRGGFKMGQVEFKDFLWEALLDPAQDVTMGDTAENLAREFKISREECDRFAAQSFARAVAAEETGFLGGEITPVITEQFEVPPLRPRGIHMPRGVEKFHRDNHVRPSPVEVLAKIRPAFGGVQTGGNSSAVVDGAGALIVASGDYLKRTGKQPVSRILAVVSTGVPPEIMGIGPVPAIRALLELAGMTLPQIDRIEINEAFAAQVLACQRELGIDNDKLNVNGGSIAIGHPLGATGVRLTLTLSRELQRADLRYGIASACIGGGQGIAILVENTAAGHTQGN
jgi:acetyl-CoA C-acetyltransferase